MQYNRIHHDNIIEATFSKLHKLTTNNAAIMSSCNFEELLGPTLLIGEGKEVYTKDLLKDKKYVM